ncbi:MAG: FAD:protein FMN transferase [Vicinamibacterales bacterium]|nr:FAD:protein FMN transferase [Vicinamibacterales bacterium]
MEEPGIRADGGLEIGQRELGGVRRFSHEAMATVFEVCAEHPDARYAAQAAHAAFDLADRLERELSRFIPNSDIGRVNHLTAGAHTRVSPATMECLVIARHVFALTGGAFDVSIGTGLPSLELDPDAGLVHATTSGVRIDLGGIGKGYAVDLMTELLADWGLDRVLVHGGFSSVLALDAPAGCDGWPLTLTDPGSPSRRLGRLSVRRTALGASGLRKGDHIVDPRSGEPACERRAAWVAVPQPDSGEVRVRADHAPRVAAAAVADALGTAFMLLSEEAITELCAESPGLETWILMEWPDSRQGPARLIHVGGPTNVPGIVDAGSSGPA